MSTPCLDWLSEKFIFQFFARETRDHRKSKIFFSFFFRKQSQTSLNGSYIHIINCIFSDVAENKKQCRPSYLKLSSSRFSGCHVTASPQSQSCFTDEVSQNIVAEFLLAFNRFQPRPKILTALSLM